MHSRWAVVPLAFAFGACKGDAGGPINPTPPTTMPACTQTVVYENSGPLDAGGAVYLTFTTSTVGRLDITVDWTFTASTMTVGLVEASTCTLDHLQSGGRCPALTLAESGSKPRKLSYFASTPTRYALIIINTGSEDESVSTQVVLSSVGCPTITAVPPRAGTFTFR